MTTTASPTTLFDGDLTTDEKTITNNIGTHVWISGYHVAYDYGSLNKTLLTGKSKTYTEIMVVQFDRAWIPKAIAL